MKKKVLGFCLILLLIFPFYTNSRNTVPNTFEGRVADIYTTCLGRKKYLESARSKEFSPYAQPTEKDVCIFVDPDVRSDVFLGFGGAVTDAVAETFATLPQKKKEELMKAYFDKKEGLNYRIIRTNMGSCDFSSDSYSYVKKEDKSLKSFDISHDEKYKIPLIKSIKEYVGDDFLLFFSPWSPPEWMKTNRSLVQGGELLPSYYQAWANYFVKFIQAYEKRGIPVWGCTVQNEPLAAQTWESCVFPAEKEKVFVRDYLGPTLERSGMQAKKIIIWDHNRDLEYQYVSTVMKDPEAAKYIWGAGIHWYETWSRSLPLYRNTSLVKEAFPSLNVIFTEGCLEKFDLKKIDSSTYGEQYASQIIHSFNSGVCAWVDWNILLNEKGGPNHVGNYCFAPVIADTKTGELYYTPAYWYIGQFSKFIQKDAKRIIASTNRSQLEATAFYNPDGKIVVVILNQTDEDMDYNLWIKGMDSKAKISAHSICTWLI